MEEKQVVEGGHPSTHQPARLVGRDQWLGVCSSYPFVGSAGACVTPAIHTAPFLGGRLSCDQTQMMRFKPVKSDPSECSLPAT